MKLHTELEHALNEVPRFQEQAGTGPYGKPEVSTELVTAMAKAVNAIEATAEASVLSNLDNAAGAVH